MTGSDPGTAYRAGTYVFTVDSQIPDPGAVIPRLMSVFGTAGAAPAGEAVFRYAIDVDPARAGNYVLRADGHAVPDVTALGTILDWIIADVTRRGVASLGRGPCLHAGAVSIDGAGVIMPGASGAGKSTLVAGLVAGGAHYLSDEAAVIDAPRRAVVPFPRPLVLDPDSVQAIDGLADRLPPAYETFRLLRHHVTPADLGSDVAEGATPIALVVEPRFVPGAATTVEALSRAELLAVLASHVFGEIDVVEKALWELRDVVLDVPGYRVSGGELRRNCAEVRSLAGSAG